MAMPSEWEAAFERLYGSGRSAMGQIVDSIGLADNLTDEEQIQHLRIWPAKRRSSAWST